jgi:hypothetical protein
MLTVHGNQSLLQLASRLQQHQTIVCWPLRVCMQTGTIANHLQCCTLRDARVPHVGVGSEHRNNSITTCSAVHACVARLRNRHRKDHACVALMTSAVSLQTHSMLQLSAAHGGNTNTHVCPESYSACRCCSEADITQSCILCRLTSMEGIHTQAIIARAARA